MATITFLFLIDRFGRRSLVYVGSAMCAFSMYYVAAFSAITDSFHTKQAPNAASNSAAAFIYIFGAGYVSGTYVIVCKLEIHAAHSTPTRRGYIAMLAVAASHRGQGVATALVKMAIGAMASRRADEIVLETEESNIPAMRLYERLGFLRSKKLHRYYLNGSSAYRLVLLLKSIDPDSSPDDNFDDRII